MKAPRTLAIISEALDWFKDQFDSINNNQQQSTTINNGASLYTFDKDFQALEDFGLRIIKYKLKHLTRSPPYI